MMISIRRVLNMILNKIKDYYILIYNINNILPNKFIFQPIRQACKILLRNLRQRDFVLEQRNRPLLPLK